MGTHIFIRLPQMVFFAFWTGIILSILFPTPDEKIIRFYLTEDPEYDYFINRNQIIFAGVCIAAWMAYRSFT